MFSSCSVHGVTRTPKIPDLASLSVSQRLDLMEEIWASLSLNPEAIPVPEWHVAEIKRRLAAHEANPEDAVPWSEVRESLSKLLGK
jgi:putative addiction module component (TIGR02574 family)